MPETTPTPQPNDAKNQPDLDKFLNGGDLDEAAVEQVFELPDDFPDDDAEASFELPDDLPDDEPGPTFDIPDDLPDDEPGPTFDIPDDIEETPAPTAAKTPPPRRVGSYDLTLSDGHSAQAVEVLVIWRDIMDGDLVVQVGEAIHYSLADQPQIKAQFLKIMREFADIVKRPLREPLAAPASVAAPPQRVGSYDLTLSDGHGIQAVEVLTIWRDIMGGDLVVQVGDAIHYSLADLPDTKAHFLKIMRDLSDTIKRPPRASLAPKPAAAPPAQREAAPQPEATDESLPEEAGLSEEGEDSDSPPPRGAAPGDMPKVDIELPEKIEFNVRGMFRRKPAIPQIPQKSIAEAIEELLQHKIEHTHPEFAGRGLHVKPSADGGVRIELDGQTFSSVGEVTDDAARSFIQETVEEWQKRH